MRRLPFWTKKSLSLALPGYGSLKPGYHSIDSDLEAVSRGGGKGGVSPVIDREILSTSVSCFVTELQ